MAPVEPASRPFRNGLLRLDPPRLLASRCTTCGATAFPARAFCAACRAVDGLVEVELTSRGRVYTFTVVRQAPPGVEVTGIRTDAAGDPVGHLLHTDHEDDVVQAGGQGHPRFADRRRPAGAVVLVIRHRLAVESELRRDALASDGATEDMADV